VAKKCVATHAKSLDAWQSGKNRKWPVSQAGRSAFPKGGEGHPYTTLCGKRRPHAWDERHTRETRSNAETPVGEAAKKGYDTDIVPYGHIRILGRKRSRKLWAKEVI